MSIFRWPKLRPLSSATEVHIGKRAYKLVGILGVIANAVFIEVRDYHLEKAVVGRLKAPINIH